MKKVINASIGGRNFTLEEDAYKRLGTYLTHFRSRLGAESPGEVMDEIEGRIAELFLREVGGSERVVSLELVEKTCATLGMPDGSSEEGSAASRAAESGPERRKLFRDPDDKRIAGVCAGLGWYLDVDVTLVRVLLLLAFVLGSAGFWIYIILWIAVPEANTPAFQCEMRGLPVTAENMARFSRDRQNYKK